VRARRANRADGRASRSSYGGADRRANRADRRARASPNGANRDIPGPFSADDRPDGRTAAAANRAGAAECANAYERSDLHPANRDA
jgi:hypothetical protein